jgi:hypothetical protein
MPAITHMGAFGRPTWFEFLFGGTTAAVVLKLNALTYVQQVAGSLPAFRQRQWKKDLE